MPLFAVICRDAAGKLQTRLDTRESHLAFLGAQTGVKLAGPCFYNTILFLSFSIKLLLQLALQKCFLFSFLHD